MQTLRNNTTKGICKAETDSQIQKTNLQLPKRRGLGLFGLDGKSRVGNLIDVGEQPFEPKGRILSITLLACKISAIVQFEHSLALPFFGIRMKTDLFQSCGHC